ncbi:unnamed protein product [Schistosoma margrebowiei]|uniref:Uncharacterized protein n=1 Tax=Schistosoma margrebowiei TaxID=48269 RepID=A0A183LY46_9TREM|nr:unnamed protein product [Schistosoma margrebowiei]
MKTSTSEGKHGIKSTAQNQSDDLDFGDGLVLPHQQMQTQSVNVGMVSASVGLNTRDIPRSSSKTRRTPMQSQLEKLWKI